MPLNKSLPAKEEKHKVKGGAFCCLPCCISLETNLVQESVGSAMLEGRSLKEA